MNKWLLMCSKDAVYVDFEQVLESEKEPGFWECENIAKENGCEWWSLERVKE